MGQFEVQDVCDAALPVTSIRLYNLALSLAAGFEVIAILVFVYMHRRSKLLQQSIPKSPLNDHLWNEDDDEDAIDDHQSSDPHTQPTQHLAQKSMGYQSPDIANLSLSSEHDDQSPMTNAMKCSLTEPEKLDIDNDTDDDQRENSYYNESQNRYFKMKEDHHFEVRPKRSLFKWSRKSSRIPMHRLTDGDGSESKDDGKSPRNRSRNQTMNMIEANTDKYRIFFVLLPIYWRFLWILCIYCVYKMVYMYVSTKIYIFYIHFHE